MTGYFNCVLCKEYVLFSLMILGSVFTDCVVFNGDTIFSVHCILHAFSALTLMACKKLSGGLLAWLVLISLEWGANLHIAQLVPLPLTVSCFSKFYIGFTFLVPADLRSPGKRAVKRARVCMHHIDAAYWYTCRTRPLCGSVCLPVCMWGTHASLSRLPESNKRFIRPSKNDWNDRDVGWGADLFVCKDRSRPIRWRCKLAPLGECDWVIRALRSCGFMSSYFDLVCPFIDCDWFFVWNRHWWLDVVKKAVVVSVWRIVITVMEFLVRYVRRLIVAFVVFDVVLRCQLAMRAVLMLATVPGIRILVECLGVRT